MANVLTKSLPLIAAGFVLAAGFGASTAARAADPANVVVEQQAQAADLCDKALTREDEVKVGERQAKAGPDMAIGDQLNMMYDARGPIRVKRFSLGCKSPDVAALTDLYKNSK